MKFRTPRRSPGGLQRLARAGGLFFGITSVCAATGHAGADDRFWSLQGAPGFETPNFNGAFANPFYWSDFSAPTLNDTVYFGGGPGVPPPNPANPNGTNPHTVYFGDFNHHSFVSGVQTRTPAVDATVARVTIHDEDWTFDFGSGMGGWAPTLPAPSIGSLSVSQQTVLADVAGSHAGLSIRSGTMNSNSVVHIAQGQATLAGPSSGTVDVSGPSARWNVGAWIDLGVVGQGTVRVSDAATVAVADRVSAGLSDGASGRIEALSGGRFLAQGTIELGSGNQNSGAVISSLLAQGGGSLVSSQNFFVGASGPGIAIVSSGARLIAAQTLRVGSLSQARYSSLNISGGSAVEALEVQVGSVGSHYDFDTFVNVSSATLSATNNLIVGANNATGQVDVGQGGVIESINSGIYLGIGTSAGAVNAYDFSRLSSVFGVVGADPGAYGSLSLQSGSSWTLGDSLLIGANGDGDMTVSDSSVDVGYFLGVGYWTGYGSGSRGYVEANAASNVHVTDNIVVGSGPVAVGYLNLSDLGTTVLSDRIIAIGVAGGNGSVAVSNSAVLEAPTNALNVGLDGAGALTVSGGGHAHSLFGRVARLGGSVGTAMVTGAHSRWDVSGTMFVGGHSSTGEGGLGSLVVRNDGAVTVETTLETWNQGTVDVRGGGRIQVGTGDSATVPPGSIRVGPGGTVAGTGLLLGDVIVNGGTLSPGHSPGALTIDGSFSLDPSSTMLMEVGGTQQGSYDQVRLLGSPVVALDGTLTLSFVNDFSPRAGDVFSLLLTGDSTLVTGSFTDIDVQNLLPGWNYALGFDPTGHTVQVHSLNDGTYGHPPPCPADYNQDGGIDGADVSSFFADWETGNTAADVNKDGGIDGADVSAFFEAWENGGC